MNSNIKLPSEPKIKEVHNLNEVSRLSSGSYLGGDYFTQSDMRIDGIVVGTVCVLGKVVIGEGAEIKGDIVCHNLDLRGTIDGNVYVKETVDLRATSKVSGDLYFSRFQVEVGADFFGNCRKMDDEKFNKLVEEKKKKIGDRCAATLF